MHDKPDSMQQKEKLFYGRMQIQRLERIGFKLILNLLRTIYLLLKVEIFDLMK